VFIESIMQGAAPSVGLDVLAEPVHALVESVAARGIGCLYLPGPIAKHGEAERLRNLRHSHCVWEVHFVGVDKEGHSVHRFVLENEIQRLGTLGNAVGVVAVDNIDEALGVLKVVVPQVAKFELTADVPAVEREVLVLERLHVKADRRDGVHCLVQFHLVEDGGLAGGVEAEHQEADGGL